MDEREIKSQIATVVGEKWDVLPQDLQKSFYASVLKGISPRVREIQLLFLGVYLGILGNLIASILDRRLSSNGLIYEVFIVGLFITGVLILNHFLRKYIHNSIASDEVLKYVSRILKDEK